MTKETRRMMQAPARGVTTTINWSVEYDGRSILELLAERPKMSFDEVRNLIINEGGFIDSRAIIHKGTAINKVFKLD